MTSPTAKKLFVLGIDGMDPKLTNKYINMGLMPNTQAFIQRGSARADLRMLGAHPTVTPPMWTTLATGTYPVTHGISGFSRRVADDLAAFSYNLDSRYCQAEPLWNVTAAAGLKTLVWHWPGSSWPPTSDSPYLHVVDGTQPAAVNMGVAQIESEFILVASEKTEQVGFRAKAASDSNIPCVITDLDVGEDKFNLAEVAASQTHTNIVLCPEDGQASLTETPFDVVFSPIKAAAGWVDAPEDAKELTILLSKGMIHRSGLLLKNPAGQYDRLAIYRSKKEPSPIIILQKDVFTSEIIDDAYHKDEIHQVNRNMRILEMAEDGSSLKMWVSAAMLIGQDSVWHPKSLYQSVTANVGYPSPESMLGASDAKLITDCMIANWETMANWQADALNYLLNEEDYQIVFSHFHNIDGQGHMIMKYLKDKGRSKLSEADYAGFLQEVYEQTDRYIGRFLHLLDEGWTVFIVSDHAQVCPEYDPPMLFDGSVSVRVMQELGYTQVKVDEEGNELHEIDWSRTKAVNKNMDIWLNLKGREVHGIVDPADKYELEEQIMTDLYSYKDKKTGKRVVALALRNKDAILLGMGGPTCGDIIIWLAEGYNYDHADSLSTTEGYADTSVSPIFIAAGPGIKAGFTTTRIIRQVDLTPTLAVLANIAMPAQCEGAPIYQILEA